MTPGTALLLYGPGVFALVLFGLMAPRIAAWMYARTRRALDEAEAKRKAGGK